MTSDSDTELNGFEIFCNLLIPYNIMLTVTIIFIACKMRKRNAKPAMVQTEEPWTSYNVVLEPDNSIRSVVRMDII